jgi:hypothetical protein
MLKNAVLTSNKIKVSITKINCFMLFREIITVYAKNRMKPINHSVAQKSAIERLFSDEPLKHFAYHHGVLKPQFWVTAIASHF